jgi:hypothetical protein
MGGLIWSPAVHQSQQVTSTLNLSKRVPKACADHFSDQLTAKKMKAINSALKNTRKLIVPSPELCNSIC